MKFVIFVLCMFIIAQSHAATLTTSYPHYEFDVPEIARGGFEMILNASINSKIQDKSGNQSLAVRLDVQDDHGLQIYIIQEDKASELYEKSGERRTFDLRLKVTKQEQPGNLLMQVFLNEDFQNEAEITFDKIQHITIGGVIEDVNQLHYDFTDEVS